MKRKRAAVQRRLSFQAFTLVTGYGRHAPAACRSPQLSTSSLSLSFFFLPTCLSVSYPALQLILKLWQNRRKVWLWRKEKKNLQIQRELAFLQQITVQAEYRSRGEMGLSQGFYELMFGFDFAATWDTQRAFGQDVRDRLKQDGGVIK